MESLIEAFLFQYKYCPLPGLGSLKVKDGNAISLHHENKMTGPVPRIEFLQENIPSEKFVSFISKQKKISAGEASLLLTNYCNGILQLENDKNLVLEHAGSFYVNEAGTLVFKQQPVNPAFVPTIPLKRVIRPNSSHAIRVGDNETTSEAMTEYFSESQGVSRQRWWIPALILFVAASVALLYYFKEQGSSSHVENIQKVSANTEHPTYELK